MTRQISTGILGSKIKGHKGPYVVKNILFLLYHERRPISYRSYTYKVNGYL